MSSIEKIKGVTEEVIRQFRPVAEAILLEGSGAYGEVNSSSDLDFEVVIKDFRLLKKLSIQGELSPIIKGVFSCLEVIESSKGIDLLQTKSLVFGFKTGIKIIELRTLKAISQINLLTLNKDLFLLSVRDEERKGQSMVYTQRNFQGEAKGFEKKFWVVLGKQFTLVPVFLFDQLGHFYPGSMTDRYLCLPKILLDKKGNGQKLLKEIRVNVARRFFMERQEVGFSKNSRIFHCLSRWEFLPVETKEKLLLEDEGLRKLFQPSKL